MSRSMRPKPAQILLRMPEELKQQLTKAAEANDRTVTSEMNARLERSIYDTREASELNSDFVGVVKACVATEIAGLRTYFEQDTAQTTEVVSDLLVMINQLKELCEEHRKELAEVRREITEVRRETSDIRRGLQ